MKKINMKLVKMKDVKFNDDLFIPMKTKTIVDSVLSTEGGVFPGTNTVVIGDPGVGKSTVLLDWVCNMQAQGKKVLVLKERMEDLKGIKNKIEIYKPKYFINAAGLTGTPNTSWCNTHQRETLMTNVIQQINIVNLCNEYSIHCTLIG